MTTWTCIRSTNGGRCLCPACMGTVPPAPIHVGNPGGPLPAYMNALPADDLVQRLRNYAGHALPYDLMRDAADAITQLRETVERLTRSLKDERSSRDADAIYADSQSHEVERLTRERDVLTATRDLLAHENGEFAATIERQAKVIAAADAMRESYRGYELGREIFAAYDAARSATKGEQAAIRALTDQPAKGKV